MSPSSRRPGAGWRALGLALLAALLPTCRRAADAGAGYGQAPAQPAPPKPDRFQAAIAEGDRAFAERGEPDELAAALAAYGRAAAERPGDAVAELRLARAEAFRGLSEAQAARAQEAWQASARAAERALRRLAPAWAKAIDQGEDPAGAATRVDPPGAEALYLLAQGVMRAAQANGYAAVLAVKDGALAMMTRAAELDERVDAAGPHRALGAWRAALPVAAGGGAGAARAHFEQARSLFPRDLLARVAEAETLAVLVQDEERFEALLREVIDADLSRDPGRAPENRVARERARALLARKARLF